ncbi:MAG: class D sortase [Ruminococcus sp.]|nr:class D sortase [Ruminococcus sp.]
MTNSKKKSIVLHAVTPLIVAALVCGILMIAMIKPYDRAKVYLHIAFMDELKTDPDNISSGLIIRDNRIIEDYSGEFTYSGELIRPKYGEMYAIIKSSSLSLDVPVYWGSDIELYERGACQSTGSVLVGDKGNSVISAHEDTYFSELSGLKKGDTIEIRTNYGIFTFKVKQLISFKRDNNKYVVPTEDTRLTLYTCKKNVLGSSDERIGVICEPTEKKFYRTSGEGAAE